jgi:hypothetical protein
MRFIRILPLLWLLADACVDRIDLPVISSEPVLVVDGLLTDRPGPHTVKLLLAFSARDTLRFPTYVRGATVTIEDDAGNVEPLPEDAAFMYNTSADFRGVVGRKYRLSIVTKEGNNYESAWEELFPSGELANISFEFRDDVINKDSPTAPHDQFAISVNGKGVTDYPNLYRWRWKGTYEFRTYPELHKKLVPNPASPTGYDEVPDPLPCSGFSFNPVTGVVSQGRECICCNCWATEYGTEGRVSKNESVMDMTFNDVFVTNITVDAWRFYQKYYIEIDQMSVSENVYQFWKLVEAQQSGAGNIFQPNVVRVKGNVTSLTDPGETVLGIFSVSALSTKGIFIDRYQDIPGVAPNNEIRTVDCRTFRSDATNEKPPFW